MLVSDRSLESRSFDHLSDQCGAQRLGGVGLLKHGTQKGVVQTQPLFFFSSALPF